MLSAFKAFAHLGNIVIGAVAAVVSAGTYVAENGTDVYVAENGTDIYVTET